MKTLTSEDLKLSCNELANVYHNKISLKGLKIEYTNLTGYLKNVQNSESGEAITILEVYLFIHDDH